MDFLTTAIIGLVIVLLALVGLIAIQRRRRASTEVVPPPELGQAVDYTAGEYQEPETFADRVRKAPLAVKLLVPLLLLAIIALGVIASTLLQPADQGSIEPTALPVAITQVKANVSNASSILVTADTTLPNGSEVTAQLLDNTQPLAWNEPDTATAPAFDGKVRIEMKKRTGAPVPGRDTLTVVLTGSGADGVSAASEPSQVSVPVRYADAFYAADIDDAPTIAATTAPTPTTATAAAATTPAPTTAAATPTPVATTTLTATVANGGNLRAAPVNGQILDQNDALDVVTLIEKTADGAWFKLTNPRGKTGWFSASLLTIDPAVAAQVPVEGATPVPPPVAATTEAGGLTAVVINGGNLRSAPVLGDNVLDQNNADEIVTLLAKSANGQWYKLTNPRGKTGWFSASLLRIEPDVVAQVPVER